MEDEFDISNDIEDLSAVFDCYDDSFNNELDDFLNQEFAMEEPKQKDTKYVYVTLYPKGSLPIDVRCYDQTPFTFGLIDPRIPVASIPKMDAPFVVPKPMVVEKPLLRKEEYTHDCNTCWICRSNKTQHRKRILHRYQYKRHRRLHSKQVPKFQQRSIVASNRIRRKGRFVQGTQWE